MANTGIFSGTDTGKTRKIAKMIHKQLGEAAAASANINRATLTNLLVYPALLLGTPTLDDDQLPGLEAGGESEPWTGFIRNLGDISLQRKAVVLFDLGDQRGYPDNFANGLRPLYDAPCARGTAMIGNRSNEGYEFSASSALEGDCFVGLMLDQSNRFDETDARLATRLEETKSHLLQAMAGSLSATCMAPAGVLASRPTTGAGGGAGSAD